MKVVIVGYGHVGKAIKASFPDALTYDPYLNLGNKDDLKNVDVAFVAVPTPSLDNGDCDISIVENVVKEINAKIIVIRSTVKIGTTKYLNDKYHKNIVFMPEFIGVSKGHIYKNDNDVPYIVIGKEDNNDISLLKNIYKEKEIHIVSTKEAETSKYMLNAFLALKVSFANEIYDLCVKENISYEEVKNILLLDPRIGKSHLNVNVDAQGYNGPCLPKDIKALEKKMEEDNSDHLIISSVINKNNKYIK